LVIKFATFLDYALMHCPFLDSLFLNKLMRIQPHYLLTPHSYCTRYLSSKNATLSTMLLRGLLTL